VTHQRGRQAGRYETCRPSFSVKLHCRSFLRRRRGGCDSKTGRATLHRAIERPPVFQWRRVCSVRSGNAMLALRVCHQNLAVVGDGGRPRRKSGTSPGACRRSWYHSTQSRAVCSDEDAPAWHRRRRDRNSLPAAPGMALVPMVFSGRDGPPRFGKMAARSATPAA